MEAWALLTAYLVGFAILQLALYRYFRSDDSASNRTSQPSDHTSARTDAGADTRTETTSDASVDASDIEPGHDDGAIHCKHCGALNERNPTYTYCRRCAQPLQ